MKKFMETKKRFTASIMAVALVLCAFLYTAAPVSAATCSSGTQTQTITVTTKANYLCPGSESITLSQTKGTCRLEKKNFFTGRTSVKTSKVYGKWNISFRSDDGKHSGSKTLSGSSVKLNLKPNKTYIITVSWDATSAVFTELSKGNYTQYPTWKVKSTYKVSNYY